MIYLFWFAVILLLASMWLMICNQKTCIHRTDLIRAIFSKDNWKPLVLAYDITSYEDELFARFFLRNWRNVYMQRLRDALPEEFK